MSTQQETPIKEEEMQSRPESPPLGLLDPSRLQNPLADQQQHQHQHPAQPPQSVMSMQQPNPDAFVMPEPRSQQQPQPNWQQRTPNMSPATSFGNTSGFESVGTPGSQRSSTGTPTHLIPGGQQHPQMHPQFVHESPTHPMTPGSGHSASGTPGSVVSQQQQQFDFHQAQAQQQAQQQAMAQAQAQQAHQMQQQQQQNQIQYPGQIMQQPAAESPNVFRPMQHMNPQMGMHQHHPSHPQFPQHQQYPHPQQWQQQMYGRPVVQPRQPIHPGQQQHPQQQPQRVPVPYPAGAYPVPNPGSMTPGSMPPGGMPPGYQIAPQGPSPAMRTAPNSGGSVQQQQPPQQPPPQQMPQRPQYPQGTAAVPPPYAYPPGQVTPTGQQFPPGSFPSPAHQMYRAGAPQNMRQYISPQAGQQASASHNRFTQPQQATASPHFAAQVARPNLVSPAIMSPGQPLPNSHPRALMSNDHPQAVRQLPGQFPHHNLPTFAYRALDHNIIPNVNTDPELFFTGCVFHVFEVEKLLPADRLDVNDVMFMIRFHGGDIDFTPKTYPEKSNVITHVLIHTSNSPHVAAPLQDGKRLVTLQWLVDVLHKQKVEVPWKLAHIPGPFNENFRPYLGKIFSLGGFDENERPAIQFMAESMGAKISPFLAKFNDLLIAKTPCQKVDKAREWGIKVVNYQWLADSYVLINQSSQERPLPENPRYQLGQQASDVNQNPSMMEVMSPNIKQMLHAWKQHVIITDEHCARAKENHQKLLVDQSQFPNKQLESQGEAPTDEEIVEAKARNEERQKKWDEDMKIAAEKGDAIEIDELERRAPLKVVVTFGNGFTDEVLQTLKKKLIFLGGKICDDVKDCTHLIVINGRRSLKLLEGICFGKNIMTPEWIIDGYKRRTFMDTLDYFMRDAEVEKELGYSCKRSVLRARHMQIFEDVEFYITPSVQPDFETTSKLVKLAGGHVLTTKPSPKYIARCIETDQPVIIISCDVDVRTVFYLAECGFPIYNADFVLMAILRQNVEYHQAFMVSVLVRSPSVRKQPQFANGVAPRAIH